MNIDSMMPSFALICAFSLLPHFYTLYSHTTVFIWPPGGKPRFVCIPEVTHRIQCSINPRLIPFSVSSDSQLFCTKSFQRNTYGKKPLDDPTATLIIRWNGWSKGVLSRPVIVQISGDLEKYRQRGIMTYPCATHCFPLNHISANFPLWYKLPPYSCPNPVCVTCVTRSSTQVKKWVSLHSSP